MQLQDLIIIDPEILGGQPVFKGTCVPIEMLLGFDSRDAAMKFESLINCG